MYGYSISKVLRKKFHEKNIIMLYIIIVVQPPRRVANYVYPLYEGEAGMLKMSNFFNNCIYFYIKFQIKGVINLHYKL